jgi:hypothetical protein
MKLGVSMRTSNSQMNKTLLDWQLQFQKSDPKSRKFKSYYY